MKRSVKLLSRGKDVDLESQKSNIWENRMRNQFAQTLRNTGRIEQLEAGQADIRELFKAILTQQWPYIVKSPGHVHAGLWFGSDENLDTIEEQQEDIEHWKPVRAIMEAATVTIVRPMLLYEEKLSAINMLYGELEENFAEIPCRIALCSLTEKELASLEELLEDEETEYLAWCVSLIRDVLDYNYAEALEEAHLELLKKAIDLICKNGTNCNKEDYQGLHKEFLESGLTLVPISQKAIDNYEE